MPDKVIATNRQARRDYTLFETVEAGIELKGTEVKSLRDGKANLKDSFARLENKEAFIYNLHISPYVHGGRDNVDPMRVRKLLLHRREIEKLAAKVRAKGFTLVPLSLYFKNGFAKMELAVAQGKKFYDKREELKRREAQRDIERAMKSRRK